VVERHAWALEGATLPNEQKYDDWLKDIEGHVEDGEKGHQGSHGRRVHSKSGLWPSARKHSRRSIPTLRWYGKTQPMPGTQQKK
jgi:hypothetical protein